jgi:hypothetical protein
MAEGTKVLSLEAQRIYIGTSALQTVWCAMCWLGKGFWCAGVWVSEWSGGEL